MGKINTIDILVGGLVGIIATYGFAALNSSIALTSGGEIMQRVLHKYEEDKRDEEKREQYEKDWDTIARGLQYLIDSDSERGYEKGYIPANGFRGETWTDDSGYRYENLGRRRNTNVNLFGKTTKVFYTTPVMVTHPCGYEEIVVYYDGEQL